MNGVSVPGLDRRVRPDLRFLVARHSPSLGPALFADVAVGAGPLGPDRVPLPSLSLPKNVRESLPVLETLSPFAGVEHPPAADSMPVAAAGSPPLLHEGWQMACRSAR